MISESDCSILDLDNIHYFYELRGNKMAILKCKMCGGSLDVTEGMTVCECEYCGSMQTIPSVDDEKKITLFTRANRLRAACEFDKAAGVYENIVSDFPEEAEAYWGLVLCKFGIEYVDDPATGKKIPTCHRSSFESIMDDPDYEQTMENADVIARKVYREEAKTIDGIQKGILEISGREEPYDIFICYKETDDSGNRTVDSVMAQDIYNMLTENKYRVFFARISLEDKLGSAYEPYIFAALNSARIMLAVGTDYEYYNAVWVKNEWSRFLAMMSKDKKKVLIPCYKDIDAYDMPKEFRHLQAQDMGKVGAMQDLLRGIKKIMPKETAPVVQQVTQVGANVSSLLQRAFLFIEDGNWESADQYCEKVLDIEPENAEAYLGKLMVELKVRRRERLKNQKKPFNDSINYKKVIRYGDKELKKEMKDCTAEIKEKNRLQSTEEQYVIAMRIISGPEPTAEGMRKAGEIFASLGEYKDSEENAIKCKEQALEIIYREAMELYSKASTDTDYKKAREIFSSVKEYKDSAYIMKICDEKIIEIDDTRKYEKAEGYLREGVTAYNNGISMGDVALVRTAIVCIEKSKMAFSDLYDFRDSPQKAEECRKLVEEYKTYADNEERRLIKAKNKSNNRKVLVVAVLGGIVFFFIVILIFGSIIEANNYNEAMSLMDSGKYGEAAAAFESLGTYNDSEQKMVDAYYKYGVSLMAGGKYSEAAEAFKKAGDYKDSEERLKEISDTVNNGQSKK